MAEDNKEAPGEVRSSTQVVTRVVLFIVVLIIVGGFLLAFFRRPQRVLDEASRRPPAVADLAEYVNVKGWSPGLDMSA